jgi:hypothetical protein
VRYTQNGFAAMRAERKKMIRSKLDKSAKSEPTTRQRKSSFKVLNGIKVDEKWTNVETASGAIRNR